MRSVPNNRVVLVHEVRPYDGMQDAWHCTCGAVFKSESGYAVCPADTSSLSAASTGPSRGTVRLTFHGFEKLVAGHPERSRELTELSHATIYQSGNNASIPAGTMYVEATWDDLSARKPLRGDDVERWLEGMLARCQYKPGDPVRNSAEAHVWTVYTTIRDLLDEYHAHADRQIPLNN